jgi:hypothetical protein
MNLRNSIPEHLFSYELVLAVIIAHGGNATRKDKDGALIRRNPVAVLGNSALLLQMQIIRKWLTLYPCISLTDSLTCLLPPLLPLSLPLESPYRFVDQNLRLMKRLRH